MSHHLGEFTVVPAVGDNVEVHLDRVAVFHTTCEQQVVAGAFPNVKRILERCTAHVCSDGSPG